MERPIWFEKTKIVVVITTLTIFAIGLTVADTIIARRFKSDTVHNDSVFTGKNEELPSDDIANEGIVLGDNDSSSPRYKEQVNTHIEKKKADKQNNSDEDNTNSSGISSEDTETKVNRRPIITLYDPSFIGHIYMHGEPVYIPVKGYDLDGKVEKISLYLNGVLVQEEYSDTAIFRLDGLSLGMYAVIIEAKDNDGAISRTSEYIFFIDVSTRSNKSGVSAIISQPTSFGLSKIISVPISPYISLIVSNIISTPISRYISSIVSLIISNIISSPASIQISNVLSDVISRSISDPISYIVSNIVSSPASIHISRIVSDVISRHIS